MFLCRYDLWYWIFWYEWPEPFISALENEALEKKTLEPSRKLNELTNSRLWLTTAKKSKKEGAKQKK